MVYPFDKHKKRGIIAIFEIVAKNDFNGTIRKNCGALIHPVFNVV